MIMTRRKRIIIFLLVILVLLLLLWWIFSFFFSQQKETSVSPAPVTQVEQEVIPTRPTVSEVELEEERETRAASSDVLSLSKTFVTRYGSYSNEAQFANLEDVIPLMSAAFASETQTLIETSQIPEEYYSVTTHVITVTVETNDEEAGTAQVRVTTQREEARETPQNTTVKYQDIVLTFLKEQDVWKVDSAVWQ